MRITEQYVWQLVFAGFFVLLLIVGIIILDTEARMPLSALTPTDLILITLASWRMTRLFVYDGITKFFREQFFDVEVLGSEYILFKPQKGPRRTLNELLLCPWCFGMWAAASVTFFYLLTPLAVFPVIILAVAAVASFLQIVSNLVGWQAEKLKGEVEGK